MTDNVVRLTFGRIKRKTKLPKPVLCKDCGEPIETARLQATSNDILKCVRCISCANAFERRFEREMQAIRDYQTIEIKR